MTISDREWVVLTGFLRRTKTTLNVTKAGEVILVTTQGDKHVVTDAYDYQLERALREHAKKIGE